MIEVSASQAVGSLDSLIQGVAESHEPIRITGSESTAVLVSLADWNAVQETLHLCSIPGMRESIRDGLATPCAELDDGLDW